MTIFQCALHAFLGGWDGGYGSNPSDDEAEFFTFDCGRNDLDFHTRVYALAVGLRNVECCDQRQDGRMALRPSARSGWLS